MSTVPTAKTIDALNETGVFSHPTPDLFFHFRASLIWLADKKAKASNSLERLPYTRKKRGMYSQTIASLSVSSIHRYRCQDKDGLKLQLYANPLAPNKHNQQAVESVDPL